MASPKLELAADRAKKFNETDVTTAFLFDGLDNKGQANCGYTAVGGGLSLEASFDPGKVIGMSAEIGASISGARATQAMIIAQMAPNLIDGLTVDNRVLLNCLEGKQWEGSVGASLFLGFSAEASLGSTTKESTAEAKTTLTPEDADSDDPAVEFEFASLGVEFKAGLEASVGYTYTNYFGEDRDPAAFDRQTALESGSAFREELEHILEASSNKTRMKEEFVEWANHNSAQIGRAGQKPLSVTTWWRTDVSMKDHLGVCDSIVNYLKAQKSPNPVLLDKGRSFQRGFRKYAGATPPKGYCYMALTCHSPSASAGLVAKAGAKFSVLGGLAKGEAEVKGTLASMDASAKRSYMRYQSYCEGKEQGNTSAVPVLITEDTRITYKQFKVQALGVSAEGSVSAGPKTVKSDDVGVEALKKAAEGTSLYDKGLHAISYESAIVYWRLPLPNRDTTSSLEGSGLRYGTSITLRSLNFVATNPGSKKAEQLAERLQVTNAQLHDFLTAGTFQMMIEELFHQYSGKVGAASGVTKKQGGTVAAPTAEDLLRDFGVGADADSAILFVESSFALDPRTQIPVERDRGKPGYVILDRQLGDNLQKNRQFSDPLARVGRLESIRCRFRLQDSKNEDGASFSLGFKIFGTGIGFSINKIDRQSIDALTEIHTQYYKPGWNDRLSGVADEAVPATTLFCQ